MLALIFVGPMFLGDTLGKLLGLVAVNDESLPNYLFISAAFMSASLGLLLPLVNSLLKSSPSSPSLESLLLASGVLML